MNKLDIIYGILAGIGKSAKFINARTVLPIDIVKRLKLDLFPNNKHLYT